MYLPEPSHPYRSSKAPSPDVLEVSFLFRTNRRANTKMDLPQLLLDYEKTDVDLQEKRDGDTPLHLAVRIDNEEARNWTVRTLLESGRYPGLPGFLQDNTTLCIDTIH